MSRRSPMPFAATSAPVIGNGHIDLDNASERQEGTPAKRPEAKPHSVSLSKIPFLEDTHSADVHPDALFMKYTISEVKFIQQQLRWVPFIFSIAMTLNENSGRTRTPSRKSSASWLGA